MHDGLRIVGAWRVERPMVDYSSSTPRKSYVGLVTVALTVVALVSALAVVALRS